MPTFAQNYQIGDVIYGISDARRPYVDTLPAHVRQQAEQSGSYVSCDHYNNRSWLGDKIGHTPTTKKIIDANFDIYQNGGVLNAQQAAAVKDFFDAICKSDRSPKKAVGMSDTKVTGKGNDDLRDLQIRRACKFGLEYVIMELQKTVHFVLDHPQGWDGPFMKMEDIVSKKQFNNRVPITTSELRCCFRNRERWMPTGRLKFYMNTLEVCAPWVANAELWRQYDQHRRDKHPVKAFFGMLGKAI